MSGLRKSMLVKLSLFVLAEVSTDRQQLCHRLPSDYQQEGNKLPSTSSYTPPHVHKNECTHARWQYKDIFLSAKSSQYDRKWHTLVRDGHRSTANLLSFSRLYTCKWWPLRPPCWCFAMTSACKYPQLTRTNFSMLKTCLPANRTCGQARARSVWNTDRCVLSVGNCGQQKLSPVTCPQGLPGKAWQGR